MDFKFHVQRSFASSETKLAISVKDSPTSRAFVQPLVLHSFSNMTVVPEEELWALVDKFDDDSIRSFLQAAVDVAWDMGIRPAHAQDSTNELSAVRYHLEDMRKLVLETGAVRAA